MDLWTAEELSLVWSVQNSVLKVASDWLIPVFIWVYKEPSYNYRSVPHIRPLRKYALPSIFSTQVPAMGSLTLIITPPL